LTVLNHHSPDFKETRTVFLTYKIFIIENRGCGEKIGLFSVGVKIWCQNHEGAKSESSPEKRCRRSAEFSGISCASSTLSQ
jgi:hypothetical protein